MPATCPRQQRQPRNSRRSSASWRRWARTLGPRRRALTSRSRPGNSNSPASKPCRGMKGGRVDREDLLKMLDLSGKERPPPQKTTIIASSDTPSTPTTPPSPTALVLDGWALRRGKELLEGSPLIQGLRLEAEAVADFHAAAFLPDHELAEACQDPARLQFLTQLLGTPDFRALHAATMLREDASEVAAAAFAEQFASLRRDEEIEPGGEEGEEGGNSEESTDGAGEMAALRAAGKALSRASEEVEAMNEAAGALG